MNFILVGGGPDRDLALLEFRPTATVSDLLESIGVGPEHTELRVGGRPTTRAERLADVGLYEGVELRLGPTGSEDGAAGTYLFVLSGVDAGRRFALGGTTTVGRGPACDIVIDHPSVSDLHEQLTVSADGEVLAAGGTSGPALVPAGTVIAIGSVDVRVGRWRVDDRPSGSRPGRGLTIPFNRPPRDTPVGQLDQLSFPAAPDLGFKPPFPLASVIAVLAIVGLLVASGEVNAVLSIVLAPVAAFLGWFESSVRAWWSKRRAMRRYTAELGAFDDGLTAQRSQETERRHRAFPDVAEVLRRATVPSARLWERRPAHADFLGLSAGLGEVAWQPDVGGVGTTPPEVAQLLERHRVLAPVPIELQLRPGEIVGLVGNRNAALSLARRLICEVATHHGPADVAIAVLARPDSRMVWDWVKWFPHTERRPGPPGARRLAVAGDETEQVLSELRGSPSGAVTVTVVDSDVLTDERLGASARSLLRGEAGPVAGLVIAATEHQLPSDCDTVIALEDEHGTAVLRRLRTNERVGTFLIGGVSETTARACSRSLARFDDPDLGSQGIALPDEVSLVSLLGDDALEAEAVLRRWKAAQEQAVAPLGVSADGTFSVDLCRDGPHCFVAGTTGSGKSELLRTLVAGLATGVGPDRLNFVLIDHKGGSGLDECSALPHVVATALGFDEAGGRRLLRHLEAEIGARSRALRAAGADSLDSYLRRCVEPPLARLVVVVDEIGTVGIQAPWFISSLVGIGTRGRSLGVHLVLGTDRPSETDREVEAATGVRIALRVQYPADSSAVIRSAAAAQIPRHLPGRAYVRKAPADVTLIQSARSTGRSGDRATVVVVPFTFGPAAPRRTPLRSGPGPEEPTDLSRLVSAIMHARQRSGIAAPRRWPEPLPDAIDLRSLWPAEGTTPPTLAVVALADDPDTQSQPVTGWDLASGNLLLFGPPSAGPTGALCALAVTLAHSWSPDALHLYAVDIGSSEVAALAGLPHVGAVVRSADRAGRLWLVDLLRVELERRMAAGEQPAAAPRLVLLVHDAGPDWFDFAGSQSLSSVLVEGPRLGIHVVIAARARRAVPPRIENFAVHRWVFRPDADDSASFGIRPREWPGLALGRALVLENKQAIQVGRPEPSLEAVVQDIERRWPPPGRGPLAHPAPPPDDRPRPGVRLGSHARRPAPE